MKKCRKCGEEKPLGLFFKNRAAKDGHNSDCKACRTAYTIEWQRRNPEKVSARNRRHFVSHPEYHKERARKYYAENSDRIIEHGKAYRAANRDSVLAAYSRYGKENKDYCNAKQAKRRAKKKCSSVPWADNAIIKDFYWWAAEISRVSGEQHNVDHIVPLINDTVCGLHWEGNLQILTAAENRSKGNFWWPGMNGFAQCTQSSTIQSD